jgi:hypothetical protein
LSKCKQMRQRKCTGGESGKKKSVAAGRDQRPNIVRSVGKAESRQFAFMMLHNFPLMTFLVRVRLPKLKETEAVLFILVPVGNMGNITRRIRES